MSSTVATVEKAEGKWSIIARSGVPPSPRCGSTLSFVGTPGAADSGLVLAFGEASRTAALHDRLFCNDVYKFDRTGWAPMPIVAAHGTDGFLPCGRADHAATTFGANRENIFFFGGRLNHSYLDDSFVLRNAPSSSPSWVPIYSPDNPNGRRGHGLCTVTTPSAIGGTEAIFLFGGQRGNVMLNDAWLFDIQRATWNVLPNKGDAPSPRMFSSVFSPVRGVLLVIGGSTATGITGSEIFGYDLREGRWMKKEVKDMPPLDDYTCAHFLQPSRQLLIFHPHPAIRSTPSPAGVPLYLPSSSPTGTVVESINSTNGASTPIRGSGSQPGTPTTSAAAQQAAAAAAAGGIGGVPILEECLYMMDANPRSPSLGTTRLVQTGGQKPDARIRVATALVPTSESKVEIFTYGGCKDNKELSGGLRCLNLTLTPAAPKRVEAAKSTPGTTPVTPTNGNAGGNGGNGNGVSPMQITAPTSAPGTSRVPASPDQSRSSTPTPPGSNGGSGNVSPIGSAPPSPLSQSSPSISTQLLPGSVPSSTATTPTNASSGGGAGTPTSAATAGGATPTAATGGNEGKTPLVPSRKDHHAPVAVKKDGRMKKVKLSRTPIKSRAIPAADLEVVELEGTGFGERKCVISRSLHVNEQDSTLVAQIIKYLLIKPWHTPPREKRAPFFLSAEQILLLCEEVKGYVAKEDTMVELTAPVKVFGDIHGQMEDLRRLFKAFGSPNHKTGDVGVFKYIFTGDFVDRGQSSLEVICLLMALKIRYWGRVYLIRGNHEDRNINGVYGFMAECMERIAGGKGEIVWKAVNDMFMWLPLAARINRKVLCVHGGIGRIKTLSQIQRIKRPIDPDGALADHGDEQQLCLVDLLWSDPSDTEEEKGIKPNGGRGGTSVTFGPDVVNEFCRNNDIELIIRAHQVVMDGYEYFASGHLITVFSATNYCGRDKNCGALLELVDINDILLVTPKQIEPFLDAVTLWPDQSKTRPPSPMRAPRTTTQTPTKTHKKPGFNHFTL